MKVLSIKETGESLKIEFCCCGPEWTLLFNKELKVFTEAVKKTYELRNFPQSKIKEMTQDELFIEELFKRNFQNFINVLLKHKIFADNMESLYYKPDIAIKNFTFNKVTLDLEFFLKPKINQNTEIEYKNIPWFETDLEEGKKEFIDDVVATMIKECSSYKETNKTKVEKGDIVSITALKTNNDHLFYLGQTKMQFIGTDYTAPNFNKNLIGHNVLDQVNISLNEPSNIFTDGFEGEFKFLINSILEPVPPKLTRKFFIENAGYNITSLESYKEFLSDEYDKEMKTKTDFINWHICYEHVKKHNDFKIENANGGFKDFLLKKEIEYFRTHINRDAFRIGKICERFNIPYEQFESKLMSILERYIEIKIFKIAFCSYVKERDSKVSKKMCNLFTLLGAQSFLESESSSKLAKKIITNGQSLVNYAIEAETEDSTVINFLYIFYNSGNKTTLTDTEIDNILEYYDINKIFRY